MPTRRAPRDEDGAGGLEVALVTPLLLGLIVMVIHLGVFLHATQVAITAVREGANVARAPGGTAAEGRIRAEDALSQLGGGAIRDASVTARRQGARVRVEVRGRVAGPMPGVSLPIRASAAVPWDPSPHRQVGEVQ